ncbi:DUF2867 domain-containing protein [Antrihabitans sp. YC2-6]|uniref:DUF2867 domain-containing protein n=1 Tax=Antrihabitans sp. YC2-6 TaxID=2799498 RepID=UPI0018F55F5C|nr:DUF2867 domain-containing protein [Antrihabitans sp. YC2-6]MBJ8347244.1 DUF2867 domain-containing protein [Antrihabitans sp. YC2-6]
MTTLSTSAPLWRELVRSAPPRKVERIAVPPDALVNSALADVDWSDAYRMSLPRDVPKDARFWRRQIFGGSPKRGVSLLAIRDALVRPFGLAPSHPQGSAPGAFPVHTATAAEVVVGTDDRHLDFRASILVEHTGNGSALVVTTVVRRHNQLGRSYFRLVRPFHELIVPWSMRRAVNRVAATTFDVW